MGNQTSVGNDKWSDEQVRSAYGIGCYAAKIPEGNDRESYTSGLIMFRKSLIRCHLPESSKERQEFEAEVKAADPTSHWAKMATIACQAPKEKKKRDIEFEAAILPMKFFSHGVYDRCRAQAEGSYGNDRHNCLRLGTMVKEAEKMHEDTRKNNKIVHEKTLNAWSAKCDLEEIFKSSEWPKKFFIPPLPFNWPDCVREQTKENIELMTDRTMEQLRSKFFRVHFGYPYLPSQSELAPSLD